MGSKDKDKDIITIPGLPTDDDPGKSPSSRLPLHNAPAIGGGEVGALDKQHAGAHTSGQDQLARGQLERCCGEPPAQPICLRFPTPNIAPSARLV